MNVRRTVKLVAGPLILAATVVVFARFLAAHPEVWRQLRRTSPLVLAGVLAGNVVNFAALSWQLRVTVSVYGKAFGAQENILLTAYSSLINFFGPGQSGPAVRAAYLKKRTGLRLRDYMFVTLIGYAFFAVVSALLLFGAGGEWWQAILAGGGVAAASWAGLRRFARRPAVRGGQAQLAGRAAGQLFCATLLQVAAQAFMFAIELHSINPHIRPHQVLAYTGAANLALFVALTPGAIGIREAFLGLTQRLHHVPGSAIVGANLIDRAGYLIFLGMLFAVVLGLHARKRLRLAPAPARPGQPKTDS